MEDTTIEDVLKTVENMYGQKNYSEALKVLELNKASISSGVWHYNMGTVLAKLENYPLARFHFLMADEAGFSSQEVLQNKKLVETKLEIPRLEDSQTVTDYLVKGAFASSQGILTSLGLIFVILAIVNMWKKSSYKVVGALLLSAVLVLALNWWIDSWDTAIVVSVQTIQDGPSVIFQSRDNLPVGVLVVTIKNDEWLEVIYPSRFKGWIKDSGLKELK